MSAVFSEGLWDLLEWSARNDVDVSLLHFPRFTNDFDHLWSRLGDLIVEKCDKNFAFERRERIIDPQKIRVRLGGDEAYGHLTKAELFGLVKCLQR